MKTGLCMYVLSIEGHSQALRRRTGFPVVMPNAFVAPESCTSELAESAPCLLVSYCFLSVLATYSSDHVIFLIKIL